MFVATKAVNDVGDVKLDDLLNNFNSSDQHTFLLFESAFCITNQDPQASSVLNNFIDVTHRR